MKSAEVSAAKKIKGAVKSELLNTFNRAFYFRIIFRN
jgi:hypothetical protein